MKNADKYILLGIALVLTLSILGVYLSKTLFSRPGTLAIITQNGTPIHKIDLSHVHKPYQMTIRSNNGGYNTISVEKDMLKVSDSDCPDKLCVKTGPLTYTGDLAVCLPHGLFIEIQAGDKGEIDSLSY